MFLLKTYLFIYIIYHVNNNDNNANNPTIATALAY